MNIEGRIFLLLGECMFNVWRGWFWLSVLLWYCISSRLRCSLIGMIFVSSCKCCELVSRVQPVMVLSAAFCIV